MVQENSMGFGIRVYPDSSLFPSRVVNGLGINHSQPQFLHLQAVNHYASINYINNTKADS